MEVLCCWACIPHLFVKLWKNDPPWRIYVKPNCQQTSAEHVTLFKEVQRLHILVVVLKVSQRCHRPGTHNSLCLGEGLLQSWPSAPCMLSSIRRTGTPLHHYIGLVIITLSSKTLKWKQKFGVLLSPIGTKWTCTTWLFVGAQMVYDFEHHRRLVAPF